MFEDNNEARNNIFHLRRVTMDDLTAVAALLNTCAVDQTGAPDVNENQLKSDWPTGITMTTLAELGDLRAVYRAFNDSFQDHWGHVEQPEETRIVEWEH